MGNMRKKIKFEKYKTESCASILPSSVNTVNSHFLSSAPIGSILSEQHIARSIHAILYQRYDLSFPKLMHR